MTPAPHSPQAGGGLAAFWPHAAVTVHRGHSDYPPLLGLCSAAPDALHCIGDNRSLIHCLSSPAVAVVGTRNPSADGIRAAYTLGRELAEAGFAVVSGLARGIDTAAHRGALDGGGKTIAVMATGLDRVYPASNRKLALAIAEHGAVVTEFSLGVRPDRWHFPRRNRTISGLALATVVVEAGRPSGSLLTATAASEQGREVFAYPWSVYHRAGEGCRWLLSQGAQLACGAADVVEGLGCGLQGLFELGNAPELPDAACPSRSESAVSTGVPAEAKSAAGLWEDRRSLVASALAQPEKAAASRSRNARHRHRDNTDPLVALIGDGELDLPELSALTALRPEQLLLQLGRLELEGHIRSTPLGYRKAR